MKSIMFFAFGFILCFEMQAQSEVRLPSFYKGCGVIFAEKSKVNVSLDLGEFFEPSIEDVKKSEQILYENLGDYLERKFSKIREEYPLIKEDINKWKKTINNADTKKLYRNYNRQYAGFINEAGERFVYMRLLNIRSPKQAKKYFENWKEEVMMGFGNFYEENTRVFVINIDRNEITR
jgi:hypothetical protein